ncbi:hypothetical protein [Mycobacterium shigaense]|uniref:Uncharacterized protein n=1 Tax=Mycobacterium shigaense TaxID=722731 RepID=A0A1Z4EMZ4_9MYCO|nr:hypothetical protein [Mycobacterium shigaense]MEA1120549.1 hypothetical protein [Mycobacterium shigaense]PRI14224.1 hypothetical protein B2J96_16035 [Mycobacterium shigaense]BAX94377.1 hypothetical protein MSG_04256 [Mycobacterium shigaense]
MDVEQLRRVLAGLPGEMPVLLGDSALGWLENAALYVAPAHIDRRISGNYVYARHRDGADNCHALLVSGFGQPDEDVVEISPQPDWPTVIDVEAEPRQPRSCFHTTTFGDLPSTSACGKADS